MLVALAFDLGQIHLLEITIDFALLAIFSSLFFLAYHRPYLKTIHWAFGAVYILLIALNYFQFGGIHGITRFSYYSGFFVIVLIYSGWRMVSLLIFQSSLLLAITYLTFDPSEELKLKFLDTGHDPTNFIFAVLVLGIGTYFLKSLIEAEISKYTKVNDRLKEKVSQAKVLNVELVKEGQALQSAQNHLANEVNTRESALKQQEQSIETYISLNSNSLQVPFAKLNKVMRDWPDDGFYSRMLEVSHAELETVLKKINETLQTREELNRSKIRDDESGR
jgi:hypothetical protein